MDFEADITAVYFSLIAIAERYYYSDERAYDLAAEAVARALEHRDRYDGRRPLLTWCRAIMRNLWHNEEARLSAANTQRLGEWDEAGGEEADQRAKVEEILSVVRRCRSVAVETLMDFAAGYSIAEIAEARRLPEGTVKRRIHDARKLLKKLINVK